MVRTSDAPYSENGSVTSELNPDPAIVGHELIHASHIVSGTATFDDTATHDFVVRAGNTFESIENQLLGKYRVRSSGPSVFPPTHNEVR